jgi:hypothetical protein
MMKEIEIMMGIKKEMMIQIKTDLMMEKRILTMMD